MARGAENSPMLGLADSPQQRRQRNSRLGLSPWGLGTQILDSHETRAALSWRIMRPGGIPPTRRIEVPGRATLSRTRARRVLDALPNVIQVTPGNARRHLSGDMRGYPRQGLTQEAKPLKTLKTLKTHDMPGPRLDLLQ